jgi:subtilase family serine protease
VEWAHAIAPEANILLVEANSNSFADLYTAVDYARHQPGVVTVSMSFGSGEVSFEPNIDTILTTPAGHIGGWGLPGGVTFVASTGDNGAPGGYPAYSPNVVAVGGTSLYLDDSGNYLGEAGWSGSGGGISQLEPEPAYQYSVQNTGARTIPDVSYNADPDTGVWIYNTVGSNGWSVIGGISAGAPQWAALMALADQGRAYLFGAGSLDRATETLPALYTSQMRGDFFEVTDGYNGYYAGSGYDLVTGLGSPYAPWVVSDLAVVGYERMPPDATAPTTSATSLMVQPGHGGEVKHVRTPTTSSTFLGSPYGSDWATSLSVPVGHGGEVNHVLTPTSGAAFGRPHGSDWATSLAVATGHGGETNHVRAPTSSVATFLGGASSVGAITRGTKGAVDAIFAEPFDSKPGYSGGTGTL